MFDVSLTEMKDERHVAHQRAHLQRGHARVQDTLAQRLRALRPRAGHRSKWTRILLFCRVTTRLNIDVCVQEPQGALL